MSTDTFTITKPDQTPEAIATSYLTGTVAPPPPHKSPEVVGLEAQIERLSDTLATVRETLRQSEQRHRDDIALIGERLIEEAESRNWCSEFDHIVDDLNSSLHVELPLREHEFTVEAQITVRVSVTARDESAAKDAAADILDSARHHAYMTDNVSGADLDDEYSWSVEQDD